MAIAVETIGFQLMAALGVIKLNPLAFIPAAQIVGGFAFGMGMVLAGGCASGVTYRIGEGNAVAIIAATFTPFLPELLEWKTKTHYCSVWQTHHCYHGEPRSLCCQRWTGSPNSC